MTRLIIAGAGGTGSWLVAKAAKLVDPEMILVIDGDKLEPKNMDRQLFDDSHIGLYKASALSLKYGVRSLPEFFHSGLDLNITATDVLFCCADNFACTRAILQTCDEKDCLAVICKNQYTDAEAYWYERSMKDTPNDPRIFYPVILTDRSGDPLAPEGCTGEAQTENRQLVLANDMASALAGMLYWFHTQQRPLEDVENKPHFPIHYKMSVYGPRAVIKWGDRT